MGIFDSMLDGQRNAEAPKNIKGYDNVTCFESINAEAVMDELAIFETQISMDFEEKYSLFTEGVELISEGVMGDLWAKVKAFVKKIWAKIRKVLDNILIFLSSKFMKKHKDFAKKYDKDIRKKLLQNLDGLKLEYYENLFTEKINSDDRLHAPLMYNFYTKDKDKNNIFHSYDDLSEFHKANEDFDADDYFEHVVETMIGEKYSKSDINKDLFDDILGDEETYDEEKDVKKIGYDCLKVLKDDADANLKIFKKTRDSVDKCFSKLMDDINKADKNASDLTGSSTDVSHTFSTGKVDTNGNHKLVRNVTHYNKLNVFTGKDGNKANKDATEALTKYRSWLSLFTKKVNVLKEAMTAISSIRYKALQAAYNNMRKVLVKIYTFNPKKESSFNEDAAYSMMNYIDITEGFEPLIIL